MRVFLVSLMVMLGISTVAAPVLEFWNFENEKYQGKVKTISLIRHGKVKKTREYSPQGLLLKETQFDSKGQPKYLAFLTHNSKGQITKIVFKRIDNNSVLVTETAEYKGGKLAKVVKNRRGKLYPAECECYPNGLIKKITSVNRRGKKMVWEYEFDSKGNLKKCIIPKYNGSFVLEILKTDKYGNPLECKRAARKIVYKYTYDSKGNWTKAVQTTHYTNSKGKPSSFTNTFERKISYY